MNLNELATRARNALEELKAVDLVEIDVRGKTSITDLMFVASGTSSRHVKSIADNVVARLKDAGVRPLGVEGGEAAEWVLVDLGDVVVHVMQQKVRDHYRLESIWEIEADAPLEEVAEQIIAPVVAARRRRH